MEASIDERIWQVVQAIPEGMVCSYGQVAELAGLGRGARRVGLALRRLSPDTSLPWHRVVAADGRIALRGGDGPLRQQQRLEDEGITLIKGRVDIRRYGWRG